MKTAIQELIERYYLFENGEYKPDAFKKHFAEFYPLHLLKEKEQIEIAFDLGRDEVTSVFIIDGEDYYNKKFNQNK